MLELLVVLMKGFGFSSSFLFVFVFNMWEVYFATSDNPPEITECQTHYLRNTFWESLPIKTKFPMISIRSGIHSNFRLEIHLNKIEERHYSRKH